MSTNLVLSSLSRVEWPAATPLLIAHRGLSARFPENTIAAFAAAQAEQCPAVELDVQLTRDGQLVAFHDADLLRITGRPGSVSDFSYSELLSFDAGLWKDSQFIGERIPRLVDADVFWTGHRRINLELKPAGPGFATAEALATYVRSRKLPFIVSSFDWELLRFYRKMDSTSAVAVLFEHNKWEQAIGLAKDLGAVAVNPDVSSVNPLGVMKARLAGLNVNAFTVNDIRTAVRLARAGVTGLFSDDPAKLHRELESSRRQARLSVEERLSPELAVDVSPGIVEPESTPN